MRKTIKTGYQLYQEVFSEFAGESGHVDIALPPTFFNPIDTYWPTRLLRPRTMHTCRVSSSIGGFPSGNTT